MRRILCSSVLSLGGTVSRHSLKQLLFEGSADVEFEVNSLDRLLRKRDRPPQGSNPATSAGQSIFYRYLGPCSEEARWRCFLNLELKTHVTRLDDIHFE